jgi:hypothetical protein
MLSDFNIAPGQGVFEGTRGFRIQGVGSEGPVSIVTRDRDRCRPVAHPEAPVAVRRIETSDGTLTSNILVPEVPSTEDVQTLEVTTYRAAVGPSPAEPDGVRVVSTGYIRAAPVRRAGGPGGIRGR